MSAFMVCDQHIDALLTAGLEKVGHGSPLRWLAPVAEQTPDAYQRGAPWGPASLEEYHSRKRELTREAAGQVGAMLLAENAASVQHRYDDDSTETPYVYSRFDRPLTPVAVLKAINCFEYQSCEHPEWEQSEAHAFCQALTAAMIRQLPGYEDAEWEIRETPPTPEPKAELLPYVPVAEAIPRLRRAIKARCKTLSVRRGRGTASCWMDITGSGEYGTFTAAEVAALKAMGFNHGSNSAVVSPDDLSYWLKQLNA